jgi:hypothetical protein
LVILIGLALVGVAYKRRLYGYGNLHQNVCLMRRTTAQNPISDVMVLIDGTTIVLSVPFLIATVFTLIKKKVTYGRNSQSVMVESDERTEQIRLPMAISSSQQLTCNYSQWLSHFSKYKTLVLFMIIVIITISLSSSVKLVESIRRDEIDDDLKEWTACVFRNYDHQSNKLWNNKCGSHPRRIISSSVLYFSNIYGAGIGIVFALTFIPQMVDTCFRYDIIIHITALYRRPRQIKRVAPVLQNDLSYFEYIGGDDSRDPEEQKASELHN